MARAGAPAEVGDPKHVAKRHGSVLPRHVGPLERLRGEPGGSLLPAALSQQHGHGSPDDTVREGIRRGSRRIEAVRLGK